MNDNVTEKRHLYLLIFILLSICSLIILVTGILNDNLLFASFSFLIAFPAGECIRRIRGMKK